MGLNNEILNFIISSIPSVASTSDTLPKSLETLYAFSTENWSRPVQEISALFLLLKKFIVRERENILKKKFKDFDKLINASINEMLARTLITTITTLFGSLSLLVFGGIVIRDFALALTIGFIVGTYSSIFIASPILKSLHKGRIPDLTPKEHLF